jgi:hypothetical protein
MQPESSAGLGPGNNGTHKPASPVQGEGDCATGRDIRGALNPRSCEAFLQRKSGGGCCFSQTWRRFLVLRCFRRVSTIPSAEGWGWIFDGLILVLVDVVSVGVIVIELGWMPPTLRSAGVQCRPF